MQAYFELYREFEKKISYILNQNDSCDAHFHSNIEIFYVRSGCIEATIRGERRRLTHGNVAIATSYEPHGFCTVGSSEVAVFLFPSEIVPDFVSLTEESVFRSPYLDASSRIGELVAVMNELIPYADREVTLTAKGYMYAILGILMEEIGLCRRTERNQSYLLIRKLLIYIEEHFKEPITLAAMAHHFGYHKDYLSKVFNNRIGCGFNRYVNLLRARHARHLIATSRKSLDEISLLSGFQCMKSFRRAFLEYYGKTPYEYRSEIYEKPI